MHGLIDGLYSGVAGYLWLIFACVESICTKALPLRNLIDFKIVHVVHPFIHFAIECELMWYDFLLKLWEALAVLYNVHV